MVQFGEMNTLTALKVLESGVILDGGTEGEILLSKKETPPRCKAGDSVEVFVYRDAKAGVTAAARKPRAVAGQFALLQVVDANSYGAFLDWGLEHDLRVPVREQNVAMKKGQSYVVYLYNDKNNVLSASSRLNKFLGKNPVRFMEGQQVDLVIGDMTPLGYTAIIKPDHVGVLYKNELFQILKQGQELKGFIKKIREDGKIDLSLQKPGANAVKDVSRRILNILKAHGGSLNVSDKTSPEKIYSLFGVSKKQYKKAVGGLYKKRLISLEDQRITLIPNTRE